MARNNILKFQNRLAALLLLSAALLALALSFASKPEFLSAASCPGVCQKDSLPCAGEYQSGLCPGAANFRCCMPTSGVTGPGGTRGTGFGGGETIQIANPLVAKTIPDLIDRITNFLVYIATPIVVLMMFWGAFQIMTAGGEPEKAITGRRTITYTVVGYILLLVAKGITAIIANVLGVK